MRNKTSDSHSISREIILLVCDDENKSCEILGKLFEGGASVVGPVSTARLSLALAALTAPTLALVASPPTGKRGAAELARTLMRDWDIPSIILCDREPAVASTWDPRSEQLENFRRAMGGRQTLESAAA